MPTFRFIGSYPTQVQLPDGSDRLTAPGEIVDLAFTNPGPMWVPSGNMVSVGVTITASGVVSPTSMADLIAAQHTVDNSTYALAFKPEAYGTCPGDNTDVTTYVQAAITAAQAAGGTVVLGNKRYTCLGALAPVFTSPASIPTQAPLRITAAGVSGGYDGALGTQWPRPVNGGPILDLRYDGTDTLHPAKIDTRGTGWFELDHITLVSGGTDNFPFFQTTNTTLDIHHNVVIGNAANSLTSCAQDAFLIGGSRSDAVIGAGPNDTFQGFGTRIHNNLFDRIRRGVFLRNIAESVLIEYNSFTNRCGAAGSIGGIELDTGAGAFSPSLHVGGVILAYNRFEMPGYTYPVHLVHNAVKTACFGNTFWDVGTGSGGAATTAAAFRIETGCTATIFGGYSEAPAVMSDVDGLSTSYGLGDVRGPMHWYGRQTMQVGADITADLLVHDSLAPVSQACAQFGDSTGAGGAATGHWVVQNAGNPTSARVMYGYNAAGVANIVLDPSGQSVITVGVDKVITTGHGPTSSRKPADWVPYGMFYDTTLSKPIWSDGTAWRDAAGTAV
jgi:hypothetical protein